MFHRSVQCHRELEIGIEKSKPNKDNLHFIFVNWFFFPSAGDGTQVLNVLYHWDTSAACTQIFLHKHPGYIQHKENNLVIDRQGSMN
jgi:hypothetical protein